MKFSERAGIVKPRSAIQIATVDAPLRNSLWTVIDGMAFGPFKGQTWVNEIQRYSLIESLWINYFKYPIDEIDGYWPRIRDRIRNYFFQAEWHQVLDLVEFIGQDLVGDTAKKFIDTADLFLAREMSAYRFVGTELGRITDEKEIAAIESALTDTSAITPVKAHLESALTKLTDRAAPDYRNSVKESISAVEAICQMIVGQKGATLGQSLKKLKDSGVVIDPALEKAWSSLYGWTSGAQGIRHALTDLPALGAAEAQYMLVSCSAFVSYLISASKAAGVKLQ